MSVQSKSSAVPGPQQSNEAPSDRLHPLGQPGPFQIIDNQNVVNSDQPLTPPRRRYACPNYETCLDLAAALNWDNFTCRGCSGEINQALYWRAFQAMKKDRLVRSICDLPDMKECKLENGSTAPRPLKIAGKV